jgi:hypothetical protein
LDAALHTAIRRLIHFIDSIDIYSVLMRSRWEYRVLTVEKGARECVWSSHNYECQWGGARVWGTAPRLEDKGAGVAGGEGEWLGPWQGLASGGERREGLFPCA